MSRTTRTAGSDAPPPPRESPRLPPRIRATADPKRPARDRSSPRLGTAGAAAPGGVQKKAAGARVTDLETRLGYAEEELRKLKAQLASPDPSPSEKAEESEASSAVVDAPPAKDYAEEMLELETKLWKTGRELASCQAESEELRRLVAEEKEARAAAEAEIGRLKAEMEQWRKAAHAAAAIVCAEGDAAAAAAEPPEEGRRRSSVGKRALVELWKRKGHLAGK